MNARHLPALALLSCAAAVAAPPTVDDHLKVDQFGYRPGDQKIAVIGDPQLGWNAPDPFTPGATYEVRRYANDTVAWSGPVVSWRSGATHAQSGDRVWRVDFSSLTETGSFYLWDPQNAVGSYRFEIAEDVYRQVLKHAVRSFYYQRCGTARPAAQAGSNWADTACHVGAQQDLDCRWVLNPTSGTSRDLHGGWHDAGDYNKYVNLADGPVHDLLSAYEIKPAIWADDYGIPESGNGTPDLLDEVKYELDWFLRMQEADGSVLHKVSVTNFNAGYPPSTDTEIRRYAEVTASATISTCGVLAHGAIVFKSLPDPAMQAYGNQLQAAAELAWTWLANNPGQIPSSYNNQGFQNVPAEDDAYGQATNMTCAAAYLYVLTGNTAYRAFVDANYASSHLMQWTFAYPFESEYQDGLLYYGRAAGASSAVVAAIRSTYAGSVGSGSHLAHFTNDDDAYRAYLADQDYTWGSNKTKGSQGSMYVNMLHYGLDPGNATQYNDAASGFVHYIHGINPAAFVYLSNMAAYGAERSAQEFYHSWFSDGSPWDNATTSPFGPAPGFVPGGANPSYQPDPAYTGPPIEPPMNQPIQKSYRDWNTSWPENSWEVTENGIYYQAAYVKLLSWFVSASSAPGKMNHLTGAGLGDPNANRVRVFDGAGNGTTTDFSAYGAGRWGVNVASGDLDGGATQEIVTGPGPGTVFGPQVRGFQPSGTAMGKVNFYAYGTLKYGTNVASRNLDGDAFDEMVSGAGPGAVFGPHVRGWNFDATSVATISKINFFAYATLRYGVNVSGGDVDGDGFAEILTGPGPGTVFGPQVRGFNVDGGIVTSIAKINFNAFTSTQYGVNVAGGEMDGDAWEEIPVAMGPGPAFPSRFLGFDFDAASVSAMSGFDATAFPTAFGGRVGEGDVGAGAEEDLLAGAGLDPTAPAQVKGFSYTGSSLAPLASTFTAFPGYFYGVNVTGGDLGF